MRFIWVLKKVFLSWHCGHSSYSLIIIFFFYFIENLKRVFRTIILLQFLNLKLRLFFCFIIAFVIRFCILKMPQIAWINKKNCSNLNSSIFQKSFKKLSYLLRNYMFLCKLISYYKINWTFFFISYFSFINTYMIFV